MKKYQLIDDGTVLNGIKLYQIKALTSFGKIKAGEVGGYIEKESNLSQEGHCWVGKNAKILGNVFVTNNAVVMTGTISSHYHIRIH